jgi:hypothetical protein
MSQLSRGMSEADKAHLAISSLRMNRVRYDGKRFAFYGHRERLVPADIINVIDEDISYGVGVGEVGFELALTIADLEDFIFGRKPGDDSFPMVPVAPKTTIFL